MKFKNFKTLLLFLAGLTVFISCKDNSKTNDQKAVAKTQEDSAYVVEIKAIDYAFQMPDSIKSGWVTFHFTNEGSKTHVARIGRLKDGMSREKFDSIRAAGEFPKEEVHAGGPGIHSPGQSSIYTTYLKPGNYQMACFLRTEDDKLHANLGMMRFFRVTEEVSNNKPPEADMKIDLDSYSLDSEGDLHTGRQTVLIDGNEGKFDIHLVKLEDESTMEAMLDYYEDLTDPTQANFLGGTEEGGISYFTVDLKPGNYIWGSDEYALWGMYEGFEITNDDKFQKTRNPDQKPVIQEVSIKMNEFDIEAPEKLSPGKTTFHLSSNDSISHRVFLAKLHEGKTKQDYYKWVEEYLSEDKEAGPYPAWGHNSISLGVLSTDSAKQRSSITIDQLSPGNYVIDCYSKSDDEYHTFKGELAEIHVE